MANDGHIAETIDTFLSIFGNRWNLMILGSLFDGPKRFNELKKELSPITQTVLVRHLRILEDYDVIERTKKPGDVTAVYYSFSPSGYAMVPSMISVYNWINRRRES